MRSARPSSTAQNVAMARSHLTWRGVLDDPWAETMLRPRWTAMDRALRSRALARLAQNRSFTQLAARTLFYDEAVTSALDDGIGQVVVAAGYDSRAWRLARAGVRFFEVDHPATQADKRRRAPAGGPRFVPVDLGCESPRQALGAAGFTERAPTLFTVA